LFIVLLVAPAMAQNQLQPGATTAATGPAYDVSVGYTYLQMAIPGAGHVNANGLDVSGRLDLSPRWGATIDSDGVLTTNVFGTPHDGYALTLQTGPVFYAIDRRKMRIFVRALGGVGRVDGAVPISDNKFRYGWVVRPAYALGAGVEHSLSGRFAVRFVGDYLRTSFLDSAATIQPQNSFRFTVSVVVRPRKYQYRGF